MKQNKQLRKQKNAELTRAVEKSLGIAIPKLKASFSEELGRLKHRIAALERENFELRKVPLQFDSAPYLVTGKIERG